MRASKAFEIPRSFCFCLGLIFLCVSTFTTRALAQERQDAQLLKTTFTAGDFQATYRLASDMIARQPNNGLAHYYLGRSLARFGRIDAARKELTKCRTLSRGTELWKFADQALTDLLPYDERPDKYKVDPQLSAANTQERQRILLEQDKEMQAAQKRFDERVNLIQKSATPEELKVATQREYAQLNRDQESITERYQRRADALLRRASIPSSGGHAAIAPSLTNSSHVQNYVHSEDPSKAATIPSENPMDAHALKLGEETGKRAVKTSGKSQSGGK